MCQSKNVLEERTAPAQIIFRSSNFNFCPIINLALIFELYYPTHKNENGELNPLSVIGKIAIRAKQKVGRHLKKKILLEQLDEMVGTHNIR